MGARSENLIFTKALLHMKAKLSTESFVSFTEIKIK